MTQITTGRTATEERALKLLGSGISPEIVASTLGVSPSRISQLMSDEKFAEEVTLLRFQNLQKHNEMDANYDALEDKLFTKFKDLVPLIQRPMEALKALEKINAMKRRGQSAPESITHQNQVVNLFMPVKLVQKFTTNINNQVIQAGNQELLTVQSGNLEQMAREKLVGGANGESHDKITYTRTGTEHPTETATATATDEK